MARPESGVEPATGSYFVSAYPPFSVWNRQGLSDYREALAAAPDENDLPWGIYVHVPYCVERCHFCYYLSHDKRPEEIDRTVSAIVREAEFYADTPAFRERRPTFVYFGGGTPSLLSVSQSRRLFAGLQASFDWRNGEEISFECAPRSVTPRKCALLRENGITRVSLGVQQMNDAVLRANGRVHLVEDVTRALATIRGEAFDVVNVDLISGLIGETDRTFDDSLEQVIALEPDSVTLYLLEIPENTPLYRALQSRTADAEPADWPVKRERLQRAMARLEAVGYDVCSAYTAARTPAARRFVYQVEQYRGADLLGLGVSAFGYVGGVHQQNLASLDRYLQAVESGELPLGRAHRLEPDERLIREFVLQLKLGRVDRAALERRHHTDIVARFRAPLAAAGEAGWLRITDEAVTLTREGLLRVDRLLPAFYRPGHREIRYS